MNWTVKSDKKLMVNIAAVGSAKCSPKSKKKGADMNQNQNLIGLKLICDGPSLQGDLKITQKHYRTTNAAVVKGRLVDYLVFKWKNMTDQQNVVFHWASKFSHVQFQLEHQALVVLDFQLFPWTDDLGMGHLYGVCGSEVIVLRMNSSSNLLPFLRHVFRCLQTCLRTGHVAPVDSWSHTRKDLMGVICYTKTLGWICWAPRWGWSY